jgi:hypothetical protein
MTDALWSVAFGGASAGCELVLPLCSYAAESGAVLAAVFDTSEKVRTAFWHARFLRVS